MNQTPAQIQGRAQVGFTPGPWETGSLMTQVQIWPAGWNVPLCIADCHAKHAPKIESERVANARLIAAAPELLELLSDLTKYAGEANAMQHAGMTVPAEVWSDLHQSVLKARAIIAKATGQTVNETEAQ